MREFIAMMIILSSSKKQSVSYEELLSDLKSNVEQMPLNKNLKNSSDKLY